MKVLRPRHGGVFHLVATNGKVLCRLNTKVPNAVGREDLGGFTLQRHGDVRALANYVPGTMPHADALASKSLCGRCRKSASIRRPNADGTSPTIPPLSQSEAIGTIASSSDC